MKAKEIKVDTLYRAKVNGKLVTVRVEAIRRMARTTYYDVTNLTTGRRTSFRSAMKFRSLTTSELLFGNREIT